MSRNFGNGVSKLAESMKTEKDYEEFFALLNKHRVRYCIIGSYAVAFYSNPRYTKDVDLLVEPTRQNAERLLRVLKEFGFGSLNLSERDFANKGQIIQLGYEPVRIDLITSLSGLPFGQIWKNRKRGPYGRQKVNFIDLNSLIRSKKLSGRAQDIADLEILTRVKRRLSRKRTET